METVSSVTQDQQDHVGISPSLNAIAKSQSVNQLGK